MGSLRPIRRDPILQGDLDELIFLRNQIDCLRKRETAAARLILEHLLNGAEVEPGAHVAEIETVWTDGARRQKLVVR